MATQSERKALIFLAAVACLGVGARVFRARRDDALAGAGSTAAIDGQLHSVDSARLAERSRKGRGGTGRTRSARPAPDSAPAAERASRRAASRPVAPGPEPPSADRPWIVGRLSAGALGVVVPGSSRAPRGGGPPSARVIDVDVASAEEIEALPGVGPALARRIVADREARGPFGSIEALTDVPGIGKRMADRLAPNVTFSGTRRPLNAVPAGASDVHEKRRRGRARASP